MLLLILYSWWPYKKKKEHNFLHAERRQIRTGIRLLNVKDTGIRRNQMCWHVDDSAARTVRKWTYMSENNFPELFLPFLHGDLGN